MKRLLHNDLRLLTRMSNILCFISDEFADFEITLG